MKALSKNISVRSILGRFLEHSRVFYFQNGGDEEIYIGSADMMPRNLDRRVEALAAVKSPELREQLKLVLDLALSDNSSAWTLDRDGRWQQVRPEEGEVRLDFQEQLMRHPTSADARPVLEQELKLSVEGPFVPTLPAERARRRGHRGAARARPARDVLRHARPAAGPARHDAAQPHRRGATSPAGP